MKKLSPLMVSVVLAVAQASANGAEPAPAPSTEAAVATAPKMTISNEKPDARLLVREKDLVEASFSGADPEVPFPTRAGLDRVYAGRAAVAVMLDAEGNATDFLVVRYTQPVFAEAIMGVARRAEYLPRRIKADPVPGRFYIVRVFSMTASRNPADENEPPQVSMNVMEHAGAASDRITDSQKGPKLIYKAHEESELDDHILKVVAVAAPSLPDGIEVKPGEVLKVIVTFYVDETGGVRIPNVESDTPASLVTSVIKTVADWKFAPPMIKGKPVLVFANRTLTLDLKP